MTIPLLDEARVLAALRGDTDTSASLDTVHAFRRIADLAERHPRAAVALAEGDRRFPDDPRRQIDGPAPWESEVEPDPETGAAFAAAEEQRQADEPDEEHAEEHEALADGRRPTDAGNSERLALLAAGRIHYVHAWGKWLVYRDGVWRHDPNNALVTEVAKGVARQLFTAAAKLDRHERDQMWKWAKRSESAARVADMIALARGIPGVVIDHGQLDQHPDLLNVANGTVDLRTGRLLEHDPAHLLTKQAPVNYDPEAQAPLWARCLDRWQPDAEMRAFLQRVVGSGATGRAPQRLLVNSGSGGNGKGAFFGAVSRVLGPFVVVPHKSLFTVQRQEQHGTVKAALHGARLLIAPESENGDRLAEGTIKTLTGGDEIECRRMREDPWKFLPTHTAVMHTNHKPNVPDTDDGIWRRVRLVPWDVQIPDAEKDLGLPDKLAAEASGILNWIVAGSMEFLDGLDLGEPEKVLVATAAYREGEDQLARFFAECCTFGPGKVAAAGPLRKAYEEWCVIEGEAPHAPQVISERLKRLGCSRPTSGRHRWLGLGLLAEP